MMCTCNCWSSFDSVGAVAARAALQMLYLVRSERLLMEEIDYNILFRWFVELNLDDAVWDAPRTATV